MEQTTTPNSGIQLFACPGCNAQMHFNPKLQQLECDHCGTHVPIDSSTDHIKENSLRQQIQDAGGDPTVTVEQLIYKCNRCGAQAVITTDTATYTCAFCNYEMVNPVAYKTRVIQPSAMVPFKIDRPQSDSIFKTWLGRGIWAPNDLKKFAREDSLHGIYLPFWTYDAETSSDWTGYGGRYYYTTEVYTDSSGNKQTRQVQHTEWIYRSGTYNHFFDDILIGGATELSQSEYETIFPFNLDELVNFDAKYISGWEADVYDVTVNDGYEKAEAIMARAIREACEQECRIDTYKDVSIGTTYANQSYKHILLPVWLCTYMYKQAKYSFIINGQTGKIYGKKPVSAVKVVIAVLLALIIIIAIIYFAQQRHSTNY